MCNSLLRLNISVARADFLRSYPHFEGLDHDGDVLRAVVRASLVGSLSRTHLSDPGGGKAEERQGALSQRSSSWIMQAASQRKIPEPETVMPRADPEVGLSSRL